MRGKIIKSLYLIILVSVQVLIGCEEETVVTTETALKGTVKNIQDEFIYPAYLILDDTLLTTTDVNGEFEILSLESGSYSLLFSSINYADKNITIDVEEGQITNTDIILTEDESVGWLVGEFQDKSLYEENVTLNPLKKDWSAREIMDGVSGATIQTWKLAGVPESEIYLGDNFIHTVDEYGQFGVEIQSGTYPFTATCLGFEDTTLLIKVEPDSDVYTNFILSKK